jgi:hypothetical protein
MLSRYADSHGHLNQQALRHHQRKEAAALCVSRPGKAGVRLNLLTAERTGLQPDRGIPYRRRYPATSLSQATDGRQRLVIDAQKLIARRCWSFPTCLSRHTVLPATGSWKTGVTWHMRHCSRRELLRTSRERCMARHRQVSPYCGATIAGCVGRIAIGRRGNMLSGSPPRSSLFVRPQL